MGEIRMRIQDSKCILTEVKVQGTPHKIHEGKPCREEGAMRENRDKNVESLQGRKKRRGLKIEPTEAKREVVGRKEETHNIASRKQCQRNYDILTRIVDEKKLEKNGHGIKSGNGYNYETTFACYIWGKIRNLNSDWGVGRILQVLLQNYEPKSQNQMFLPFSEKKSHTELFLRPW